MNICISFIKLFYSAFNVFQFIHSPVFLLSRRCGSDRTNKIVMQREVSETYSLNVSNCRRYEQATCSRGRCSYKIIIPRFSVFFKITKKNLSCEFLYKTRLFENNLADRAKSEGKQNTARRAESNVHKGRGNRCYH